MQNSGKPRVAPNVPKDPEMLSAQCVAYNCIVADQADQHEPLGTNSTGHLVVKTQHLSPSLARRIRGVRRAQRVQLPVPPNSLLVTSTLFRHPDLYPIHLRSLPMSRIPNLFLIDPSPLLPHPMLGTHRLLHARRQSHQARDLAFYPPRKRRMVPLARCRPHGRHPFTLESVATRVSDTTHSHYLTTNRAVPWMEMGSKSKFGGRATMMGSDPFRPCLRNPQLRSHPSQC